MRDFEKPNRSVAVSRGGMAATSNPASTLAAVNVLQAGGNAMDAAIAAVAVQCVVEPGSTGIGGDCFCLYAPGGSGVIAYNGSGRAPSNVDLNSLKGVDRIPPGTPDAVTIPGAVEAWSRLCSDHGTVPLGELLQPAIGLARNGYVVAPRAAHDWQACEGLLALDDNARRIFLRDGKAPEAGDVHRQPELANSLEMIAREGARAFYEGEIASDIVSYLKQKGGVHSLEDFRSAAGEYVTPIKSSYRGLDVYECPPNGQGVIALLILNILAGFDSSFAPLSADRIHLEIEATRLAYSVRDAYLADPSHAKVPVEWLLSEELAGDLRRKIDLGKALTDLPSFVPSPHKDTVYISVVDKDRNTVSFINSLFALFGCGLVSPRSGVLLHNRGESFSLKPGHPNCLAPRKRPLHTIIPAIVMKADKALMSFGVMGGHYQAMGHAHFLTKVVDYGMDLQTAIEQPRVFPVPGTDLVEAEGTVPPSVIHELETRGFKFKSPARPIGGAQAIQINWENGTLIGGSDPRKDGCALGTVF
jgi:gamma-glutamyltranspeptidase/glutathione hydrolase